MPRTIRNEFDKKLTDILYNIIARKIQDLKLLSVIKQIIYSTQGKKRTTNSGTIHRKHLPTYI